VKVCIYCGQLKEVTKDHVIPKCLFTQPYPLNLVTVPACDNCNREKSLNDDYLRDYLVTDNYVSQSPTAQEIFIQKTLSSQRQGSSVIAREVVSKARFEPLYTKGGIYIGDFPSLQIDGKRIETIFKTFVKGLYYDSQKKLFPDGYVFDLRRHFPWDFHNIWAEFTKLQPRVKILGNVFGCAFQKAEEDDFTTIWLFWFYERIAFSISATNPKFVKNENT
jgi:hypothetical protein